LYEMNTTVLRTPVSATRGTAFGRGPRAYDLYKRLDSVEIDTEHGRETVTINALPRTFYWAILKFMYLNHDRRVGVDELCRGVAKIMEEECADKWTRFRQKQVVKAARRVDSLCPLTGRTVRKYQIFTKTADHWNFRLISNARNLCRLGGKNAYGRRLVEKGHVMRYETDHEGNGEFILYTKLTAENMAEKKRGRKANPMKKPVGVKKKAVAKKGVAYAYAA
jgi:hypothetical protein